MASKQDVTNSFTREEGVIHIGGIDALVRLTLDQVRTHESRERVDRAGIRKAFADLAVTEQFITRLGPAINSGRSILLYGPPGNGKSSVADRIIFLLKPSG